MAIIFGNTQQDFTFKIHRRWRVSTYQASLRYVFWFLSTRIPQGTDHIKTAFTGGPCIPMACDSQIWLWSVWRTRHESIHHKIRIIADNHHGIINPVSRLLSTIEEHHLHTLPEVKAQVPAIKVRRLYQMIAIKHSMILQWIKIV